MFDKRIICGIFGWIKIKGPIVLHFQCASEDFKMIKQILKWQEYARCRVCAMSRREEPNVTCFTSWQWQNSTLCKTLVTFFGERLQQIELHFHAEFFFFTKMLLSTKMANNIMVFKIPLAIFFVGKAFKKS